MTSITIDFDGETSTAGVESSRAGEEMEKTFEEQANTASFMVVAVEEAAAGVTGKCRLERRRKGRSPSAWAMHFRSPSEGCKGRI